MRLTRNLIAVLIFLSSLCSSAQNAEYVFRNAKDSTRNCYLKIIPEGKIKGIVVRDFTNLPDTSKTGRFNFTELCTENQYLTLFTVTTTLFPELFVEDTVINMLDEIIEEVIAEHEVPRENIFVGGISSSGARAFRFAEYCAQGKSKYKHKVKGVFGVDPPLDLARFYNSILQHQQNFKAGMAWEAEHMTDVFNEIFKGVPDEYPLDYQNASVFSHGDSLGGNAQYLVDTDIILFHEPDIDWWMEERGCSYFDINSYDVVAFAVKLRELGNEDVEVITTANKGVDAEGNHKCHDWSIVDEEYLIAWIIDRTTLEE